jgi:hypothetical protein
MKIRNDKKWVLPKFGIKREGTENVGQPPSAAISGIPRAGAINERLSR